MRTTILGFALGAVLAAGVVFLVMRKTGEPQPVQQAAVETPAQPATPVTPAEAEKPTPAPLPEEIAKPEPPRRERPSAARPKRTKPTETVEKPAPEPATSTPPPPAPVEQPAPTPAEPPKTAAVEQPKPEPRKPATVTIAAGTLITARIGQTISSESNQTGDTFSATLDQPLVVDGFVVAERGARLQGKVISAEQAGRVKGKSSLSVHLTQLTTADGQKIELDTAPWAKQGESSTGRDAAKVAAASAIGAAIGAIAGGGKGAAIGAGVGAGAGTGGVLAARGKATEIPVETRISFKLNSPVTITERLK